MTCDPALFSDKNIPNIAKSNRVFPGKGRGDKEFIWHNWITQWVKFFCPTALFIILFVHLQEKTGVKVGPKMLTLGPSLFHKYLNLSKKISNTVFVCWSTTSGENFSSIRPYWGSKGPKTSKKRLFQGCWIGTQNLQNFQLNNPKCYTDETYHDYVSSWECTPFFLYKKFIFDPRPENCFSFSKKSPQKIV